MELKEFVKNVLIQTNQAVDEARKETSREIRFTQNESARTMEFDIAVTASDETSGTGRAGVKVLSFMEAGGNLSQQTKNSTISRVQFGLDISYTTKEEDRTSSVESGVGYSSWPDAF